MFLSLIQKRRSVRKYLKKAIEPERINSLIEAALRAPSSRSLNPWQFIVVDDPELLEKLAKSKQHGSAFLKDAPLGIVVCADPGRSDVWVEDASITSTYIQLTAESLGLGSCWIQIRERMHDHRKTAAEYVKEILGIAENINVESIISLGYPNEQLAPHPKDSLDYEKVFFNKYGEKNTSFRD